MGKTFEWLKMDSGSEGGGGGEMDGGEHAHTPIPTNPNRQTVRLDTRLSTWYNGVIQ